jgi:single-strand DNA-binding protein
MRTNSVQLIGYVGQNLSEKTFSSGKKITLRVATVQTHKNKEGKVNYISTWHDVVAWDAVADYAAGNFVKGSRILVEGFIIYRTYPDLQGHLRYVTEIKATFLHNLDR